MKKLIVAMIAISLLVGVSSVFAQTAVTGLTGKGIKAGLNLAKFTGADKPDDSKMYLGFTAGGFITYAFTDLFAVQPELLFSMKGNKIDVAGVTGKTKLNYIEVPVLFKVLLSGGGNFKPNFYAGPEVSFLLSAKQEMDPEPPGFVEDIKDNIKSTDFGLIGGVGFDYLLGTGSNKVTVDIRYDVGFSKLDDSGSDLDYKNSAITFLVGFGL